MLTTATSLSFESERRLQETRVERWLVGVRQAVLLAITIPALLDLVVPFSPIPLPALAIPGLIILTGTNLVLALLLWRVVHYWPLRKYLFAAMEVILPQGALVVFAPSAPPVVLSTFALGLALAAIVLAGLRYAVGVVVSTGILASMSQVVIAMVVPAPYGVVTACLAILLCVLVMASMAYGATSLVALHQQAILKEQLARFLAPELVSEVLANPAIMAQQTRSCIATVLFADIRGFTALSEHLAPQEVVDFLNLFLSEMTAAIMEHRGMVDKYIGDAIMGVFGAPASAPQHATLAVHAALAMRARLTRLNEQLRQRQLPTLDLGVGIHTGELVVGAIGSQQRLDYTVIGDTVNLASRVESLTRHYEVGILISAETHAMLEPMPGLRELGTIDVKNRRQPVTVWTIDPAISGG